MRIEDVSSLIFSYNNIIIMYYIMLLYYNHINQMKIIAELKAIKEAEQC